MGAAVTAIAKAENVASRRRRYIFYFGSETIEIECSEFLRWMRIENSVDY